MPPAHKGRPLQPAEVETLRAWIAQRATYNEHWAFVRPSRHAPLTVRDTAWARSTIDRLMLAMLEQAGLKLAKCG